MIKMLYIDEDETIFKPVDFPSNYINFIHPEDYVLTDTPIYEEIFHRRRYHNRIFVRICFKVDTNSFLPLTFIIDTGCPMYLCPKAKDNLKHIIKNDELDVDYIEVLGKKMTIDKTPHVHENVNIIGLMALSRFGFSLMGEEFSFESLPEYF